MEKLYSAGARFSLALFFVLGGVHLAALFRLIAPPIGYVFAAFPFILIGQLITIAGFGGGKLTQQTRFPGLQMWKASLAALRFIPKGWRYFGLPFWYAYVPLTFFTRLIGSGGQVFKENGQFVLKNHGRVVRDLTADQAFAIQADHVAAASVILTAFAFAHFICLAYVIPNRAKLLAELGWD